MATISSNEIGNPYHDAKGLFTSATGGNDLPTLTEEEYKALNPDWSLIKDQKTKDDIWNAINYWQSSAYSRVNRALRARDPEAWRDGNESNEISSLDKAFEIMGKPLPHDAVLYRGIRGKALSKRLKEGSTITDKGFTSTTHSLRTAADLFGFGETGVVLHITAKKGTMVFKPKQERSEYMPEPEIMLNRGSRMRVTKRVGNNVYAELT